MENPYQLVKAKIERVITETPTIKTLVLRPEKPLKFQAGQFMQVAVQGMGECPFTPSSDPLETNTLDFTIMKAGSVTSRLHKMREGEILGVRGPYGKPYPLKDYYGKEIYIIGGGVGLAPLRSLLFALFHEINKFKKIEVRFGARTSADISYKTAIEDWKKRINIVITVDAGSPDWMGNVGLVTAILKDKDVEVKNSAAIVCGPPVMMKFATKRLIDMGFRDKDIYLSMEKNMSCGIGKCFHCSLGKYFVCKDGPIFTWEQIKEIPDPW